MLQLRFPFLFAILALIAAASARGAEPVYTLNTSNGEVFRATVAATDEPSGKTIRLRMTRTQEAPKAPGTPAAPAVTVNTTTTLTLDAGGKLRRARTETSFARFINVLEATPLAQGVSVRTPELTGTVPLGAPFVTPVDTIAFLGKRYDFARGGPQHFAFLIGNPGDPGLMATLTLESAGQETIKLEGGEVAARKLRVGVSMPDQATGPTLVDVYVGPDGEFLKSSVPLFGVELTARGPSKRVEGALVTDYQVPGAVATFRRTADGVGYRADVTVANVPVAYVKADKEFRPTAVQHLFFGRSFEATVTAGQIQWKLAPSDPLFSPVEGEPWFLTHMMATDLWESSERFAGLQPGNKLPATLFFLEVGIPNGINLTVERMNDTSVSLGDGREAVLRHWRLTYPTSVTDLWSDGKRLVKLAGSDKTTITREGWEKATAGLKAPALPAPPPAAP